MLVRTCEQQVVLFNNVFIYHIKTLKILNSNINSPTCHVATKHFAEITILENHSPQKWIFLFFSFIIEEACHLRGQLPSFVIKARTPKIPVEKKFRSSQQSIRSCGYFSYIVDFQICMLLLCIQNKHVLLKASPQNKAYSWL